MDKSTIDKLGIDLNKKEIISFVGGGGKTTTIKRLAGELKESGKKVLCTTSTSIEIFDEKHYDNQFIKEIPKDYIPKQGSITVFGEYIKNERFYTSNIELIEELIQRNIFDYILIESDGSRQHPIKAPNTTEPVISKFTTITVGLIGLDCLGQTVTEAAHRPEIFKEIIGVEDGHLIDYKDIVNLVRHKSGLFKNAIGRKVLYLNKVKEEQMEVVNKIKESLVGLDIHVEIGKFDIDLGSSLSF